MAVDITLGYLRFVAQLDSTDTTHAALGVMMKPPNPKP